MSIPMEELDPHRLSPDWAQDVTRRGAGEILLTSMDKDGTKSGFDIALTKEISENVTVPVIASGGGGKI